MTDPVQPKDQTQDPLSTLLNEVAEMRELVLTHFPTGTGVPNPQEGARIQLQQRLMACGLSPVLCDDLLGRWDIELGSSGKPPLIEPLLSNLLPRIDGKGFFDQGGVFAFVGPTGVGKTTVIAKIAARCAVRYGHDQVALIAMDSYRIAAEDQLKAFAQIIGLPVLVAHDGADLATKVQSMAYRRVIIIDTTGVNHRDLQMLQQLQRLDLGAHRAKKILVTSGTTNLHTLEDVILMHERTLSEFGAGIDAAIVTKTDEAAQLAPSVDCLIRHQLPLLFIGFGQHVPEDLGIADVDYLCRRALHPRRLGESMEMIPAEIGTPLADKLSDWRLMSAATRAENVRLDH